MVVLSEPPLDSYYCLYIQVFRAKKIKIYILKSGSVRIPRRRKRIRRRKKIKKKKKKKKKKEEEVEEEEEKRRRKKK